MCFFSHERFSLDFDIVSYSILIRNRKMFSFIAREMRINDSNICEKKGLNKKTKIFFIGFNDHQLFVRCLRVDPTAGQTEQILFTRFLPIACNVHCDDFIMSPFQMH